MPSLTHVCMWSEHGWRPITAYKAEQQHPGGSVSSHGHLFMCELCRQYVSLAHGLVYTMSSLKLISMKTMHRHY